MTCFTIKLWSQLCRKDLCQVFPGILWLLRKWIEINQVPRWNFQGCGSLCLKSILAELAFILSLNF